MKYKKGRLLCQVNPGCKRDGRLHLSFSTDLAKNTVQFRLALGTLIPF